MLTFILTLDFHFFNSKMILLCVNIYLFIKWTLFQELREYLNKSMVNVVVQMIYK